MSKIAQRSKRGLSGQSGFVSRSFHISMPYGAADDEVFIWYYPKGDNHIWRRRVKASTVERRGWQKRVLKCVKCGKPATKIDHHWPYMSDYNLCDEHGKK